MKGKRKKESEGKKWMQRTATQMVEQHKTLFVYFLSLNNKYKLFEVCRIFLSKQTLTVHRNCWLLNTLEVQTAAALSRYNQTFFVVAG